MSVIVCLSSGGEKCFKFQDQTPVADAVYEIRNRLNLKGGGIEDEHGIVVLSTDFLHTGATYRFENGVSEGDFALFLPSHSLFQTQLIFSVQSESYCTRTNNRRACTNR